ncbi:MAG: hypothetical protein FJW38_19320 [Acidobacteria bacterium]|nr:hypothetical protein [Acidobacteriota bacterium]
MNIRFQADANLDPDIARGVQLREPSIHFRPARGVLADGRVLVTRDVRTMRGHFEEFLKSSDLPGVLLTSNGHTTGTAIDGLRYVWLTWTEDQLRNPIHFLPRI